MDQHNNNKNSIDDIDQRIIEALQQDGRRPFTKIAADLGISEASVRQRVSNLINNQVMQIVAVTNPIKLGFSLASMIGIRVSGDRLIEAAQEISAFDEVIYLILCTGSFNALDDPLPAYGGRDHSGDELPRVEVPAASAARVWCCIPGFHADDCHLSFRTSCVHRHRRCRRRA